jgi:hypothetical protein
MNVMPNKHCFIFLLLLFVGCGSSPFDVSYTEVKRLSSPDSLVDALIIEVNGGATTPFVYDVYLVPKGRPFRKDSSGNCLFSADNTDSLKLYWKSERFLEIQYEQARIFNFLNFWQSSELQDYRYIVEIRLTPLAQSSSLLKAYKGIMK